MTMNQEGYPVFKGLQKPLEFMGIRGRFLTLAAATIGVSFVGFIGFSIALGKVAGFIAMMVMALVGLITIYIKQRGGLHNKKRARGIYTKQWDATIPYIEQNRLAPWTHNKTIQKAIESYRITPEQKEYMRTLKIK